MEEGLVGFWHMTQNPYPPILYLVVLAAYRVSKGNAEARRATFEKTVSAYGHEEGKMEKEK